MWRYNGFKFRRITHPLDPLILVNFDITDSCKDWDAYPTPNYIVHGCINVFGFVLLGGAFESYDFFCNLDITILNCKISFDTEPRRRIR